jgi:hypothetical protein
MRLKEDLIKGRKNTLLRLPDSLPFCIINPNIASLTPMFYCNVLAHCGYLLIYQRPAFLLLLDSGFRLNDENAGY